MELFYFDIINFLARKYNSSSVVGGVFFVYPFPVTYSHLGSTKFAERTAVSSATATA